MGGGVEQVLYRSREALLAEDESDLNCGWGELVAEGSHDSQRGFKRAYPILDGYLGVDDQNPSDHVPGDQVGQQTGLATS
jgi:hypothetical protein